MAADLDRGVGQRPRVALTEVQGYAYEAAMSGADLHGTKEPWTPHPGSP